MYQYFLNGRTKSSPKGLTTQPKIPLCPNRTGMLSVFSHSSLNRSKGPSSLHNPQHPDREVVEKLWPAPRVPAPPNVSNIRYIRRVNPGRALKDGSGMILITSSTFPFGPKMPVFTCQRLHFAETKGEAAVILEPRWIPVNVRRLFDQISSSLNSICLFCECGHLCTGLRPLGPRNLHKRQSCRHLWFVRLHSTLAWSVSIMNLHPIDASIYKAQLTYLAVFLL